MPWPSLWGEGSPKFGDLGLVQAGRTDGLCIPIDPMTFRACLRPFLLPLGPAQLLFPLSSPFQYGVCSPPGDGVRTGGSRMGPLGCQEGDEKVFWGRENVLGSPLPQKIAFFTLYPLLFWLKTSDEEQGTCTDSSDAVLHLRGFCLDRGIQQGWGWDTKSLPPILSREIKVSLQSIALIRALASPPPRAAFSGQRSNFAKLLDFLPTPCIFGSDVCVHFCKGLHRPGCWSPPPAFLGVIDEFLPRVALTQLQESSCPSPAHFGGAPVRFCRALH